MPDKRRIPRKPTYLTAYAGKPSGARTTLCKVRDLTRAGARLVSEQEPLPDLFDLEISGRTRLLHAEIVWRREAEVGVRFVAASAGALKHSA